MTIQSNTNYRPSFKILKLRIENSDLKTAFTNKTIKKLNDYIDEFNKKDISSKLTSITEDFNSLEKSLATLSQETAKILNNDTKLTEEAGIFFSKILIDAYLICKCNKKNYNKENKIISRKEMFFYDENTLNIKGCQKVNPKRSILSGYFKDAICLYNSIYHQQDIKERNSIISLENEIKLNLLKESNINFSSYFPKTVEYKKNLPRVAESKSSINKRQNKSSKDSKETKNSRPIQNKKGSSKGNTDESKKVPKSQNHELNPVNSNIAESKSRDIEDHQAKVIAEIEKLTKFNKTQKKEFLDFLIPIWKIQAKQCTNNYNKKLLLKLILKLLLTRIDDINSLTDRSDNSENLCNQILEITNENTKNYINNAINRYLKDLKDKN